jgi:hypothetical protein
MHTITTAFQPLPTTDAESLIEGSDRRKRVAPRPVGVGLGLLLGTFERTVDNKSGWRYLLSSCG